MDGSLVSGITAGKTSRKAGTGECGQDFRVSRLLINAPSFSIHATAGEAYDFFEQHPEIPCVAVLSGDEILGLVDRASLFAHFSRHLMRDYYVRRPIALVLDRNPLIADLQMPIRVLAERVTTEKPEALTAGFVIIDRGRYAGVGTAIDMMKAWAEEAQLRALELAESRRTAEEANRVKSLFLANMSHEFRTPLNAIIGFSEILATQKFGELNSRQIEYIGDIKGSGVHLLALISDILDLSKAESGKLELHDEPIELDGLVHGCIRLTKERLQANPLHFSCILPEHRIYLLADAIKMKQILMNLLTNAIKFTPAGGKIEVVATILDDGGLEIAVIDTGIGMSPEQIPLVLQAFVQIDNSRNRSHQGTGLGLPLCKQLIDMHGGSLIIESTLGEGTAMRVRLPPERVPGRFLENSAA